MSAVTAAASDFTLLEIEHLESWCRANKAEVAIEALGSDLADEVAYIGQGFGVVSWTIHRSCGQLWLSLIGNWAGRCRAGWTVAVGSVEQATARIAGMLAADRR